MVVGEVGQIGRVLMMALVIVVETVDVTTHVLRIGAGNVMDLLPRLVIAMNAKVIGETANIVVKTLHYIRFIVYANLATKWIQTTD